MVSAAKTVFDDCMAREGVTVTSGNASLQVFFRQNKTKNEPSDHLTIFFAPATAIEPGMLLYYGGAVLLVLNKETVENADYQRADCVRCNRTANIQTFTERENPNTGDMEQVWVTIAGGAAVPIYFEVKQSPRSETGIALENSRLFAYLPAHFGIAPDRFALQMGAFTATDVNTPYELIRRKADNVDDSNAYRDANQVFHGFVVVELNPTPV